MSVLEHILVMAGPASPGFLIEMDAVAVVPA